MDIVEELMKVALLGSAWVLYLLLILSVVSIGAMIDRWWFFRREAGNRAAIDSALSKAFDSGDAASLRSDLGKLPGLQAASLAAALRFHRGGPPAVLEGLEAELADRRGTMERGLTLLGTLGNNAPFIGLFGTVIGVIEAFRHLGDQSEGSMDNVMAGIAEALVATGVGIFVAIPAVVAFNYAQNRIGLIESETIGLGRRIAAWLRSGASGESLPAEGGAEDRDADPHADVSKSLRVASEV